MTVRICGVEKPIIISDSNYEADYYADNEEQNEYEDDGGDITSATDDNDADEQ